MLLQFELAIKLFLNVDVEVNPNFSLNFWKNLSKNLFGKEGFELQIITDNLW